MNKWNYVDKQTYDQTDATKIPGEDYPVKVSYIDEKGISKVGIGIIVTVSRKKSEWRILKNIQGCLSYLKDNGVWVYAWQSIELGEPAPHREEGGNNE